ncbi:MAG: glycosyltransferase family 2 protein [Oscillospiraceae bacterium]
MKLLSVIVPCYNEQDAMPFFYDAIAKVADSLSKFVDFEIIFVNDGSKDRTLEVARELAQKDRRVHYLSFSRNFGKEAAMYAGMSKAKGDFIAIMDVDLQDPPEMLAEMYHGVADDGFDCVATRRVTRKGEPKIRSFFARLFYRIINRISKTEIVDGARDFRLMTRQMADSILEMKEYNRFSKGIFGWVGYDTKWLEYENVERVAGETKWSFWKLFSYSLEGIFAFSTTPLAISSIMGFLFCVIAFILAIVYAVKTIIWGDPVVGFPTLICVIFLIGGIQLFCIGILGQYLSKTYLECKNRPLYIIKEEK